MHEGAAGLRSKESPLHLTRGRSVGELADLERGDCGSSHLFGMPLFSQWNKKQGTQLRVRMGKEVLEI